MSLFFKEKWTSFKADKRGNFAMMTAVAFPVVAFAIGSAVDLANFRVASYATQAAVDTASIAASRAITVEDATLAEATVIAREQLSLNISDVSFVNQQEIENSLRIEQDLQNGTLTASADVQTPTLFAAIFGFDSIATTVSATNQVQSLEIAFVLDNTGSMSNSIAGQNDGSNERIMALRGAMTNAIDLLLPVDRVNDNRVRASIIPYSRAVNVGGFYDDIVAPNAPDRGSTCVTEREGQNSLQDVAPEFGEDESFYETDVTLDPARCLGATILPLTGDRDELNASIGNLVTAGRTAGHIGITWGINTLSAVWQDFWPEEAAPADYLTPNVRKILVVMTDGVFNQTYFDSDIANGTEQDRGPNSPTANATRQLCNLAKDPSRGVVVYTVTLGEATEGAGSDAQNLMAECATSPETALIAETAEELDEAFERIVIEARTPILTN